jgi:hypothetical protein
MAGPVEYGPYDYDFTVIRTDTRDGGRGEKFLSMDAPDLITALRRLADELEADGFSDDETILRIF